MLQSNSVRQLSNLRLHCFCPLFEWAVMVKPSNVGHFILKGYIMNTIKVIVDKNGFWHVYRTDKVTGQRAISFFQNVDEAKAALLK